MRALAVHGVFERLGNDAILHCKIGIPIAADTFVHRPGTGEVVQHYSGRIIHRNGIALRIADIAQTDTDKPYYHVGRIDHQGIVGDTNTVARGRLTVDSKTARFDT